MLLNPAGRMRARFIAGIVAAPDATCLPREVTFPRDAERATRRRVMFIERADAAYSTPCLCRCCHIPVSSRYAEKYDKMSNRVFFSSGR